MSCAEELALAGDILVGLAVVAVVGVVFFAGRWIGKHEVSR